MTRKKTTDLSERYLDFEQVLNRLFNFAFSETDFGIFFTRPAPVRG
jgi:hypothetical protein